MDKNETKIAHELCKEFAVKIQGLVVDMLAKETANYKTKEVQEYVIKNGSNKYLEILDKITDIEGILKELQA